MKFYAKPIEKSPRIDRLVRALYEKMPEIESDRAVLLTESYKATEGEPIITRRAKAFELSCALRGAGVKTEIDHMERSVKAQFKYADKLGVKYVAVIGGNELLEGKANVKNMQDGTSESVLFSDMVAYFTQK